jgi:hypothetical protein
MRLLALGAAILSMACGGRETAQRATTSTGASSSRSFSSSDGSSSSASTSDTTLTFSSGFCPSGEHACPWPACSTDVDGIVFVVFDAGLACVLDTTPCAALSCDGGTDAGIDAPRLEAGIDGACGVGEVACQDICFGAFCAEGNACPAVPTPCMR